MQKFPIEIIAVYISSDHDFKGHHGKPRGHNPVQVLNEVQCVAGKGLVGDRYFNHEENFKGQITFFDWSVFNKISAHSKKPTLEPSVLRRNVIIKGVDLNSLIDREFNIQNIRFTGSEECAPCYWMDQAVTPGTEDLMKDHGGLRARILNNGILPIGKTVLDLAS